MCVRIEKRHVFILIPFSWKLYIFGTLNSFALGSWFSRCEKCHHSNEQLPLLLLDENGQRTNNYQRRYTLIFDQNRELKNPGKKANTTQPQWMRLFSSLLHSCTHTHKQEMNYKSLSLSAVFISLCAFLWVYSRQIEKRRTITKKNSLCAYYILLQSRSCAKTGPSLPYPFSNGHLFLNCLCKTSAW